MILKDKIQKTLIDAVDTHAVIDRIASDFYDRIQELKKTDRVFFDMLQEYDTFREYFQAENEELNSNQKVLLKDMHMALEDEIDDSFDHVEDLVMADLLSPKYRDQILQDLKAEGVTLAPNQKLSSDIVEELYVEAYRAFDAYKAKLLERVLSLSPLKGFQRAEQIKEEYRRQKGIVFDEEDFLNLYEERLKEDSLMKLLGDRVKDVFKTNRHYLLDLSAEQDPSEDEEAVNDRMDGVLVEDGDMRDQSFTFVSELMNEYTGRRILAAENELSDQSYWTTYGDDFQDMILSYVEMRLEEQIRFLSEERPAEFSAFCQLCKLNEEDVKDTERFLLKCDKVNYGLARKVEELWSAFCEKSLKEI